MSRIFLSHSSRDTRQAVALKQWLVAQTPPLANEIFLDVDPESGLQTGTRWKDALRQANARCEAVICLLSQNWEASHECKVEYRTAENLNKQIFVARLQPSTGGDLTSEWQRCDLFGEGPRTAIDIGDGAGPVELDTGGLYRLRDGIRGAGIGADSFVWPPPSDPGRAPYRGWEPLDEADAAVFFGRDAQIVRALDAMRGMRLSGLNSLFVVLGPSGTGKSSFLRAGLLPRLRREDRRFVLMDIVRPDRDALTGASGLAAAIAATRTAFGLARPSLGEIKNACAAGDAAAVVSWLAEIRAESARRLLDRGGDDATVAPTLVLPIDQAEELFAADAGTAADGFLRVLATAAEELNAQELGIVVAATIRTDRYEVMQTPPALARLGTVLFDELKPMPPTQFKEVITGPAQRSTQAGRALRVAPDLVDRLLADAGEGADTLPILALTLSRLYTDYGSSGELTLASYQALGGMQRVVQTEIDEVLAHDPARRSAQLSVLRTAFIPWLATINADNDQPMRRVARWSDLPEASRPLIDALVAKRLMVKDTRDGQVVVEVALESLLRQWDELAGWLRDQRKDLKDADDLERAATAWGMNRQNPAWLLEGSRLTEATRLVNEPGFRDRLKPVHLYLNASYQREQQRRDAEEKQRQGELRAAREREQAAQERAVHAQEQQATAERHTAALRKRSRILRAVVAVTAVVAVVAVVGFVRANMAGNEAERQFRQATSQRLITEAQAILDGSRTGTDTQALQQLVVGQRLAAEPDTEGMLNVAVMTAGLDKLMQTSSEVVATAVSPDGRLVAAGGVDGVAWMWDAETGLPNGEPMTGHDGGIGTLAFTPDNSQLITAGADGTVRVWDAETGEPDGEPLDTRNSDGVRVIGFNTSGRRAILHDADGAVWSWDFDRGGRPEKVFPGGITTIAWNPEANRLATAEEQIIKIWDVDSGNQIGADLVAPEKVLTLVFSPDGSRLASSGADKTARLWDPATARPVGEPLAANSTEVVGLAFAPDGSFIAAAASDGSVRFYDTATQQPIGPGVPALDGLPRGLQIDDEGRRLFIGGSDATMRIYDLARMAPKPGQAAAFSPDGTTMVIGGKDGVIRRWDGDSAVATVFDGRMGEVSRVAFLPDGARLLTSDADGTLQMWDADSGRPRGPAMAVPEVGLFSFAVSGDGDRAVAGYTDGTIRLWNLDSGRLVRPEWRPGDGVVTVVAFLENDSQIAAVQAKTSSTLYIWDTDSGDQIVESDAGTAFAVAFGAERRLVAGNADGSVEFARLSSDEVVDKGSANGHGDAVTVAALSPDGSAAATGARDGTVQLWDPDTATALGQPLPQAPTMVVSLTFAPDGQTIAVSDYENAVRLWPSAADIDGLCGKLTANMSEQQWDEWVSPDIEYVEGCPDLPRAQS